MICRFRAPTEPSLSMEYLNVHVSIFHSPEYMGSEPVARATWWNLMGHCAEQENSGRIHGALKWNDRRWQQTCGITLREVKSCEELITWEGDDLVIKFYPTEKEAEVRRKREGGRAGGIRSGMQRSTPSSSASPEASSSASSTPSPDQRSTPSTERKGKERKGKEGKGGNEAEASPKNPSSASLSASRPESVAEAIDYFEAQGSTAPEAEKFFDHFQSTASRAGRWRTSGGALITDWQAAARNWIRRSSDGSSGGAAGLGGGGTPKNSGGGRGSGSDSGPFVRLPIAGVDVGRESDAAAEGGGA